MQTTTTAARRRPRGSTATRVAIAFLLALAAACYGTLPWSGEQMRSQDLDAARQAPSLRHPLGTDELGRDLLARLLYGGAISLALGLLAAGVAVCVGVTYGAVSGYLGGRVDAVLMRLVDVLYALPSVLLVMLLTVSLGATLEHTGLLNAEWARFVVLAAAIGCVSWLTVARVVRGQVLLLRELPYVEAARALGLPRSRILRVHILPNLLGPIVVFATLTAPQAILQESFLSFLGIGVQPPQATWGSLTADAIRGLSPYQVDWWRIVPPCAALFATLTALNVIGDGLRERFDPRAPAAA